MATIVGNLLSFNHRGVDVVLSGPIFAGIFVLYRYYPQHWPLPNPLASQKPVTAAAPPPAAVPAPA